VTTVTPRTEKIIKNRVFLKVERICYIQNGMVWLYLP